jgi:hypothetical protein
MPVPRSWNLTEVGRSSSKGRRCEGMRRLSQRARTAERGGGPIRPRSSPAPDGRVTAHGGGCTTRRA